jgi:hypothetical protein
MPGPPRARIADLEDWVDRNRGRLAGLGLTWRTGVSPTLGNEPPSAWVDLESRDALGRGVVTGGTGELVVTRRRDGSRTLGEHRDVPTRADVDQALDRLVEGVLAVSAPADHDGPAASS